MKHSVFGVDLAKRIFQLHSVDPETGEITSKQIKRAGFLQGPELTCGKRRADSLETRAGPSSRGFPSCGIFSQVVKRAANPYGARLSNISSTD